MAKRFFTPGVRDGLIGGAIIAIATPVLQVGFEYLIIFSVSISDFFSTWYYRRVAQNDHQIGFLADYLVTWTFISIAVISLFVGMFDVKDRHRRMKDPTPVDYKSRVIKMRKWMDPLVLYVFPPFVALSVVLFLGYFFSGDLIHRQNRNFQWKIDAVSPHISNNRVLLLKSQWSLMTNRSEFEKVDSLMSSLIDSLVAVKKLAPSIKK